MIAFILIIIFIFYFFIKVVKFLFNSNYLVIWFSIKVKFLLIMKFDLFNYNFINISIFLKAEANFIAK